MKRMKKLLVCLMTTVLVLGICLPVNTQSASAMTEEEVMESLKAKRIDPEMLWTDGTRLLDGAGSLWKFAEYIDGRWSMEGRLEKLADNVVYAGEFITADGKLLSPLDGWPEDKKVKWASTSGDRYAVVDEKGTLWVWGEVYRGTLGILAEGEKLEEPTKLMTKVEKVYLFGSGGCAIKEDGSLWSWGPGGPYIKESDKDAIVWFEHTSNGYNEYATTSKPVKVMSNVKDIWSGEEPIVLKTDNSLYVGKKKVDEDVIDVYTCIGNVMVHNTFSKSCQTVVYLKADGTLWGYGWPHHLGIETGNTYFVEKGYTKYTASGKEVVPDEKISYQCVPVKLMENVATIMNGEHELGLSQQFYVFKKDGSVVEIGLKEQKTINPRFYAYLYYFDDEAAELTASEQKIKEGVEATTIKVKSAITSDGKIKLTWTKSKGYAVDYYEVYRSTSKTKAFNQQYVTSKGTQKSYKNTSVKKGTRYYYAVRGVREINGQKYYTQWSNLANRKVQ